MGTRGMLVTNFPLPSALLCCKFAQKTYRLKRFTATSRHFCHRQKRRYRFIPTALHELTDRVRAHCGALYSLPAATQVCQRDTCPHECAPFLPFSPVRLSSHSTDLEEENKLCFSIFFSSSLSFHAKDSAIFAGILPSQRTSPTNVSRSRRQGMCIHAQWNLTWGKHPTLWDRRSRGGRGKQVKSKVGSVSHPRSPVKIKNAKQFSGASAEMSATQQAFKHVLHFTPFFFRETSLCLFFCFFFFASTTKYFTGVYFFRGSEVFCIKCWHFVKRGLEHNLLEQHNCRRRKFKWKRRLLTFLPTI